MSRFGRPVQNQMLTSDLNVGEPGTGLKQHRDFSVQSPTESKSMGYDYLAAPLAALKAGDHARAARMLEELAEIKPELIEATYHLGRAYEGVGNADGARGAYQQVVNTDGHPFYTHALSRLNALGGPLSPSGNTGIVPPHLQDAAQAAPEVEAAGPQQSDNTGIVPPHIADAVDAGQSAPVEAAAEVVAEGGAAQTENPGVAPAAEAPAKGRGKKARAAAEADPAQTGE